MQLPKNPVLYFIQALTTPVHTLADQSYLNPVCSAPVHSTPIFNINWKILLDSTTPKYQSLSRPSALLPEVLTKVTTSHALAMRPPLLNTTCKASTESRVLFDDQRGI